MQTLTRQLLQWRTREFAFRLAWGAARWVAVVIAALAACCFVDWLIDRRTDTPFALRVLMTLTQIVLAIALFNRFILKLRLPGIVDLAGQAEGVIREFDHRLVTALQLNRPGARTQGMSPELITAVTREAEQMSGRHHLASLADATRLERAAMLAVPVLLVAAAFAAFRPTLAEALFRRQCLQDVPIPRSVALQGITPGIQPAGDPLRLLVRVTGRYDEAAAGRVIVTPDGMAEESYPLTFDSKLDADAALYVAELPPMSQAFTYRARLQDGRTRKPNRVEFVPRPAVTELNAWLVLPAYVDPAGERRYERHQPQGEVTSLPDCGLLVEAKLSKPVESAAIVLIGRTEAGRDRELLRVPMEISGQNAAGLVDPIPPEAMAYRVILADEHGFANANPPRRGIASANYQSPAVKLLPEILKDPREPGPFEDFAVDGMPLALGGRVQIGYTARSPLGIARAEIWYRVNPSSTEPTPWTRLPLKAVQPNPEQVGGFIRELGVFENSGPFGQVEFYAIPSADPESEPPGIEAGGRYNFETAALTKRRPDGSSAPLDVGDQVEFLVAAYDRRPGFRSIPGESASRIKAVVTSSQLDDWIGQLAQSRARLEELFLKQRRVFEEERDRNRNVKP